MNEERGEERDSNKEVREKTNAVASYRNLAKLQLVIISNIYNRLLLNAELVCICYCSSQATAERKAKCIDEYVWQRDASSTRRLVLTYSWGET